MTPLRGLPDLSLIHISLILTIVFAYLCCTGKVAARELVTIFNVVVSFYFGTQHERAEEVIKGTAIKSAKYDEQE